MTGTSGRALLSLAVRPRTEVNRERLARGVATHVATAEAHTNASRRCPNRLGMAGSIEVTRMTTRRYVIIVGVVTASLSTTSWVSAQSADPWIGTWKLNLAKSKFDPGPPPRSNTVKIAAVADGSQKQTFDGVNAQGQTFHSERVTTFDGADVLLQAVSPPSTALTTNAFKRLGDRSFQVTVKADGKVTSTSRIVVSPDGRTLTQTTTGTNAQGQAINNTAVWDKQ